MQLLGTSPNMYFFSTDDVTHQIATVGDGGAPIYWVPNNDLSRRVIIGVVSALGNMSNGFPYVDATPPYNDSEMLDSDHDGTFGPF
jgi:hypothetical protein